MQSSQNIPFFFIIISSRSELVGIKSLLRPKLSHVLIVHRPAKWDQYFIYQAECGEVIPFDCIIPAARCSSNKHFLHSLTLALEIIHAVQRGDSSGPMGSSAFYSRFIFIYVPSLNLVLNYKLVCHIKSSTDSTSQIIQRLGDGAKMQRTQTEIFCTLSPRRYVQARKINLCVRVAWFTFAQWK